MRDRLNTIREQVFIELNANPATRDDDFLLTWSVWKHHAKVNPIWSIQYVMEHHKELDLPSTETIRRSRQLIQADYPHLRASKPTLEKRAEAQKEFHDWSIDHK